MYNPIQRRISASLPAALMAAWVLAIAGCGDRAPTDSEAAERPAGSGMVDRSPAASALMLAAARGDLAAVELALRDRADPDQRGAGGLTALMVAARTGQTDALRVLIEAGAALDLRDKAGLTALGYAARGGYAAAVAVLLRADAAPDLADEHGVTVLMEGVRSGDLAVVDLLLEAGADVRPQTESGSTLLHFAANASEAVMRRMLALGPDVDAPDGRGMTPAMIAARHGRLELLRLLETAGADLTRADADGKTALDHARRAKEWAVIDYLEQRVPAGPAALAGRESAR
jgi:ankyrin repeat protein